MHGVIRKWLLGLGMVSLSLSVWAGTRQADIVILPPKGGLAYDSAVHSVAVGSLIGSQWAATASENTVFSCGLIFNRCDTATMSPGAGLIPAGMAVTIDGVSYQVYETGVPGIGFVIGLRDPNATAWIPMQGQTAQTYPVVGETPSFKSDIGWTAKVSYIKTHELLEPGTYNLGAVEAAVLHVYSGSSISEPATVTVGATTITVTARSCTVETSSVSVSLGNVDARLLSTVGSMSEKKTFTVSLGCDPNIALYATISDLTQPGNRSDVVSLTPDSTAQGVGVAFFYGGDKPLKLGQDSSSSDTPNQFLIRYVDEAGKLTVPFQASYYRNGDIVPGTANAVAGITFSYQ